MKFMDAAGSRWVTPSWVAREKIREAKRITNKPTLYKEESNEKQTRNNERRS